MEFPEIDRVEFFDLFVARRKINPAQPLTRDSFTARTLASFCVGRLLVLLAKP